MFAALLTEKYRHINKFLTISLKLKIVVICYQKRTSTSYGKKGFDFEIIINSTPVQISNKQ